MDQSLKLFKREGKNNTKLDILGKKKKKKECLDILHNIYFSDTRKCCYPNGYFYAQ